jgi:hypothetical protein
MFEERPLNLVYIYEIEPDGRNLQGQALSLFSTMMVNGKLHRRNNTVRRKSTRLLDQTADRSATSIPNQHYAGHKSVPIDRMRGSEGRTEDFDDAFYPLHDRLLSRWLSVAAVRLAGEDLPPVELIHIGEIYFVRDGHHRISVAKALGDVYIDAEVIDETC